MLRRSPMKRAPFKAKPRHEPTGEREPKPQAKERKCAGPNCEATFIPNHSKHTVCSLRCYRAKEKAKEKAERESVKARKEALKTPGELTKECRDIVQAIARIRDRADGCISCHMGPNYSGLWHGSHFRPAGNNAAVELHLWNIHKACAQCNLHKSGNLAEYRPRLVEKIGAERVEWLESQTQPVKRTREYLMRFKKVMGKRLKRMERRIGQ